MSAAVKHILSLTGFQVEIVEEHGLSESSLTIKVIPTEIAQVVSIIMDPHSVVTRSKKVLVKSLMGENLFRIAQLMKISYMTTKLKSIQERKGDLKCHSIKHGKLR